jgi:ubiquinone/menaquinone biosynthesis C-methylase UbiE
VSLLSAIENLRILEIACGCGQLANLLFDHVYHDYVGFDFSSVAIRMAKKINPAHQDKFMVEDAFQTDIGKYHYNTVIIF